MTPARPNGRSLLQETHDAVIRLETKFGNGPGTWAACVQHKEVLDEQGKRLRLVERRIYMAAGGVAVLIFLAKLVFERFGL